MNFTAVIGEALQALRVNRLRTALTMLGMVIGVSAVVLMLAIGEGARSTVNQAIATMGSHLFMVLPGATTAGGLRMGAGTAPPLTAADAQAIAGLPSVGAAAPIVSGTVQLAYGANNWSTIVYGITPDFLRVRDWPVERGDVFSDTDLRSAARVMLLGQVAARNLFGDEEPVGKTVRVKGSPFLVVGVLGEKGQSLDGRDQDDSAMIPLTTGQRKLFGGQIPGAVRFIMVQASSAEAMGEAEAEMNQLLRQRRRNAEASESDFTVRNLAAVAATAASTAETLSLMLGAIASISLVVGGIGIMNIMLVSVTERTREIGIRMAIGASRRNILLQFLLEALAICAAGGLAGVALGVAGAYAFGQATGQVAVVTLAAIGLAVLFASAMGLFFGYYPARKASALHPVEALRYD